MWCRRPPNLSAAKRKIHLSVVFPFNTYQLKMKAAVHPPSHIGTDFPDFCPAHINVGQLSPLCHLPVPSSLSGTVPSGSYPTSLLLTMTVGIASGSSKYVVKGGLQLPDRHGNSTEALNLHLDVGFILPMYISGTCCVLLKLVDNLQR